MCGLGVGPLTERTGLGLLVSLATASNTEARSSLLLLLLGAEPEPRPLGPLSVRLEFVWLTFERFLSLSLVANVFEAAGEFLDHPPGRCGPREGGPNTAYTERGNITHRRSSC